MPEIGIGTGSEFLGLRLKLGYSLFDIDDENNSKLFNGIYVMTVGSISLLNL